MLALNKVLKVVARNEHATRAVIFLLSKSGLVPRSLFLTSMAIMLVIHSGAMTMADLEAKVNEVIAKRNA